MGRDHRSKLSPAGRTPRARRAFSLIEIMAAVAIAGVIAAAGFVSIVPIIERARRADQAAAALSQIRKMRARALTANEGAAVEVEANPGGGVRLTTAVVPRTPGVAPCQNYASRASSLEAHDYELLDIVVPRADNVLCFEATAFRLIADDGVSLAPAAAPIDFFVTTSAVPVGTLTVAPTGTFGSTFEPGVDEGLVATVNVTPLPAADEPGRNILPPRELEPELPIYATPPPNPTTPAGQPAVEPLPTPTGDPPPPPPPACNDDTDCPALFVCEPITKTCVPAGTGCVTDADCAQEENCDSSGTCVYGCNTSLCPPSPSCAMACQQLACCTVYSCICM